MEALPPRLCRHLALTHVLLLTLGILLVYGWMATLPFFADALYLTTTQLQINTPWDYLAVLDPRADIKAQEATRVVPLYRPVFLEVIVPLLQRFVAFNSFAIYMVVFVVALAAALAFYALSFALSGCQHSAFVVASFFAFHATLYESFLSGYAGLNAQLAYLLVALTLLCCRRFAMLRSWSALLLLLVATFLAVFTWERVVLLPLCLPVLTLGWRLFDPRRAPSAVEATFAKRLRSELADARLWGLVLGAIALIGAYGLARFARFGAPVASHYGTAMSLEGSLRQATAFAFGVVGLVPPFVGEWLGVPVHRLPLLNLFALLGYAAFVAFWLFTSLRARPALASLGLFVGSLLILPNFSSNGLVSLRYADMLVIGLVVTFSTVPLFEGARRSIRLRRLLVMAAPVLVAAIAFQNALLASPHHYLVTAARQAEAVHDAVITSAVVNQTRPILLLSSFFGHDALWIFSATPSRLGSFFSANFGVARDQTQRFALDQLKGQQVVLIDFYYLPDGGGARVVGQVEALRGLGAPVPAAWEDGALFPCMAGEVLAITGRRPMPRPGDRQAIRIVFHRPDAAAFKTIELFHPLHESPQQGDALQSRIFALVPPATERCQVLPEWLVEGASIVGVERRPARR